jgi:hypothetical protein
LDKHTVAILREHRRRQLEHRRDRRQAAGNAWSDSQVCVHPKDGEPINPTIWKPCKTCSGTPASWSPPTPRPELEGQSVARIIDVGEFAGQEPSG